jgi:hypothetical protein
LTLLEVVFYHIESLKAIECRTAVQLGVQTNTVVKDYF